MLHLLLLHSAVLPLLLVFCGKHHDENTSTPKTEQEGKNGELTKGENTRSDNLRKEEQTDQKSKKTDNGKRVVYDEKNYQKKEERNKTGNENGQGKTKVKDDGKVHFPDPDYQKLAFGGWTEAQVQAFEEAHVWFCVKEREVYKRHAEEKRRSDEKWKRKIKLGIVGEEDTQSSCYDKEDPDSTQWDEYDAAKRRANYEAHRKWCAGERAAFRYRKRRRMREERMKRRREGEIVESSTQRSGDEGKDREPKKRARNRRRGNMNRGREDNIDETNTQCSEEKDKHRKEKSNNSESKKSKTDMTQKSEKA